MALSFRFGTVGSPIATPKKPGGSVGSIQFSKSIGLDALELGWVQAVRVSEETCAAINQAASQEDVAISVHAPYFINLNADDEEWPKSRKRLMDAAYFGNLAGATDIIFPPGSYFERAALDVLEVAIPRLQGCLDELRAAGNPVTLSPGDSALIPTKGPYTQANLEIGVPGGDTQYYRASLQQQYFYPVSKSFTLAFNGEVAYGHGYGNTPFPVFKYFYAGGIGSVRGYQTSTLGPKDQNGNPVGGASKMIGNVEFVFPLPGSGVDRTLRLFTFFDFGNVYQEGAPITFSALKYSTGFGMSWLSPIGPLKVSMGFPLKKDETDKVQRFQFQIGTAF